MAPPKNAASELTALLQENLTLKGKEPATDKGDSSKKVSSNISQNKSSSTDNELTKVSSSTDRGRTNNQLPAARTERDDSTDSENDGRAIYWRPYKKKIPKNPTWEQIRPLNLSPRQSPTSKMDRSGRNAKPRLLLMGQRR